jgi:hypothetical protein
MVIYNLFENNISYNKKGKLCKKLNDSIIRGDFKNVKSYIKHYKNIINYSHSTVVYKPLMMAVFYNHLKIVKFLISEGADIEDSTYNGKTALTYACEYGYQDIVNVLIENGANIYNKDNCFVNMAFEPLREEYREIVKILFDNGLDIDQVCTIKTLNRRLTLLSDAIDSDSIDNIYWLMYNGACINKYKKNKHIEYMINRSNEQKTDIKTTIIKYYDTKIDSVRKKIEIVKDEKEQQILDIKKRITSSILCPISKCKIKRPTIIMCCMNVFEYDSIIKFLKISNYCPLCRAYINPKSHIIETFSTNKFKRQFQYIFLYKIYSIEKIMNSYLETKPNKINKLTQELKKLEKCRNDLLLK